MKKHRFALLGILTALISTSCVVNPYQTGHVQSGGFGMGQGYGSRNFRAPYLSAPEILAGLTILMPVLILIILAVATTILIFADTTRWAFALPMSTAHPIHEVGDQEILIAHRQASFAAPRSPFPIAALVNIAHLETIGRAT
jgi:hypothetical protein